jgi:cobalamin biosynthesis Mg chelatase CobN
MANGDSTAQQQLAKAVADSNKAPEPSLWVRIVQMMFAGLSFGGAVAVALILLLHGPPAPKEPEAPEGNSGSKTTKTTSGNATSAASESVTYVVASSDGSTSAAGNGGGSSASGDWGDESSTGDDQGSGDADGDSEESESSTADSLANLNEQAPWAFAIVALLVGAFMATGKSLNFNGTKLNFNGTKQK